LFACLALSVKERNRTMLGHLKEELREIIGDDELFGLLAQGHKKFLDALIKAGFTEEQATQIVAGQGMGLTD
jgi:hypothetical protein